MKAVCKQAMLAPSPQAVPDLVREAFRIAMSGRPGPVYIEIPFDFWDQTIDYQPIKPFQYKNLHLSSCDQLDCQTISQALFKSTQPLIAIGEGALEDGIGQTIMDFINHTQIPFVVSPIGKNAVDEFHPLYLGVIRQEGKTQKSYEYLKKSDFVLLLGDRLQEWEVAWYDKSLFANTKIAQVDPDWDEIGRVYPIHYSAVGSVSSFIQAIPTKPHSQAKQLKTIVDQLNHQFPKQGILPDGDGINPLNLNTLVETLAPQDSTIVCDTGYAKSMAIIKYRTHLDQHFIVADKNGPMGYSTPAALGAALATGKTVICFVGDGGFQMSLNELGTAMNYHLKVIYIIENNSGCGSMVDFHTQTYGHHCATTFENPDYVKIAQAYQMKGYRVETTTAFEQAFKEALKATTSVIIDAKVDQSTMVWE